MRLPALCLAAILLPVLAALSSCHSPHIEVTVENRTGAPIELLEVDYPSASFGADVLAAGADYHYRIQVRLSGPVKVQYTESTSHQIQEMTGPDLFERQEGRLVIVLSPGGKAEFHPELTAKPSSGL